MKKKIAFFTITLSGGGAERVISNLLLNLPNEEYEKYLILLDGDKIDYPYEGNLLDLKYIKKNKPIYRIINIIYAYFILKKIKKIHKFDIVISFLDIPNFLNIITRNKEKIYVSVRTHISSSYRSIKKIVYGTIIKKTYNKSDKIIAVSKDCMEDLKNVFGLNEKKLLSIPNFYDLNKIEELTLENIQNDFEYIFEKKVIINSGRLVQQKGQEYLIKAFASLKNIENYHLVFLGDGPLLDNLKELTVNLKISEKVFFLGFQKNPFKFLKKAYLFVFPSFYEGFPNALAEAMACGLPVISNNCMSGPAELLNNGKYGILLYEYEEKDLLVDKIRVNIELMEDDKIYKIYKNKSLEGIKNFSKDKILTRWEDLINENYR